eukprot:gene8195-5721_t
MPSKLNLRFICSPTICSLTYVSLHALRLESSSSRRRVSFHSAHQPAEGLIEDTIISRPTQAESNKQRLDYLMLLRQASRAADALVARRYAVRRRAAMLSQLEKYTLGLEQLVPSKCPVAAADGAERNPRDDHLNDLLNGCSLLELVKNGMPCGAVGPQSAVVDSMMIEFGDRMNTQLRRHTRRLQLIEAKIEALNAKIAAGNKKNQTNTRLFIDITCEEMAVSQARNSSARLQSGALETATSRGVREYIVISFPSLLLLSHCFLFCSYRRTYSQLLTDFDPSPPHSFRLDRSSTYKPFVAIRAAFHLLVFLFLYRLQSIVLIILLPAAAAITMDDIFGSSGAIGGTSSEEVQRVLAENRKLRQENTELKVKLESRSAAAAAVSGSSQQQRQQGDGISSDTASVGAGSTKGAKAPRATAQQQAAIQKLQTQVDQLKAAHQQQSQMFSDFTLITAEREEAYVAVYQDLRNELDAIKEEKEALRQQLEEMTARYQQQLTLAASLPQAPARSGDAGSQHHTALVAHVLRAVQQQFNESLRRVASTAEASPDAGAVLRQLEALEATSGSAGRRRSANPRQSVARASAAPRSAAPLDDAAEFFEEGGGKPTSTDPFERELEEMHATVASRALNIPHGAGALRASLEERSRKRRRPAGTGPAAPQSIAKASSSVSGEHKRRGRPAGPASKSARREDGMASDTASTVGRPNPFESATLVKGAAAQKLDLQRVPQLSSSSAHAGGAELELELKGDVNGVEAFIRQASLVPPPSIHAMMNLRARVLAAYGEDFDRIAEDAKHALLKRCTACYQRGRAHHRAPHDASTESPVAQAEVERGAFASWLDDWDAFSHTETDIWRLVQILLTLEVDRLMPQLQLTLMRSVLSLLEKPCTAGAAPPSREDPADVSHGPAGGGSSCAAGPAPSRALGQQLEERLHAQQVHALATSLSFLWLQYLLHLSRMTAGPESPTAHLLDSTTTSRMTSSIIAVRRLVLQLLLDSAVAFLQQWHSPTAASSAGDAGMADRLAAAGAAATSSTSRPHLRPHIAYCWMTLLYSLAGRTVERLHVLQSSGCPWALYDMVFTRNMLVMAPPVAGAEADKKKLEQGQDHGIVVMTIKAVMAECFSQLHHTDTAAAAAAPPFAEDAVLAAGREVWRHFTEVIGWAQAAPPSVERLAASALQLALREEKKASKRTTTTSAAVKAKEREKEEESEEDEEEEDTALLLTPGDQARAIMAWERRCGMPLLALRLIVLHRGFNFINAFVQPKATGQPRGDDLMAYVLSGVVMDLRWVGSAALEDVEGAGVGPVDSPSAGQVEGVFPLASEADVSRRVLHYLTEYVMSANLPFALLGTVRVMSVAALVQLVSSASPRAMQHHLEPVVKWLRGGLQKFAAQRGLAVSENAKQALPQLLPRESAWGSKTGLWVLDTLFRSAEYSTVLLLPLKRVMMTIPSFRSLSSFVPLFCCWFSFLLTLAK